MKKVVFLFVLIGCTFVIDRIGGFMIGKLLRKSQFRYVRMYEGKDKSNIVVLGNSRGVNGFFSPYLEGKLGESVANISYNGLKSELATNLLGDYVDIYKPRLVLIEGTMLFNEPQDTSLVRDFKIYINYSNRIERLLQKVDNQEFIASKLFHLYNYNTPFLYRNLYYLGQTDKTWINNYKLSSRVVSETKKMEDFKLKINRKSLNLFKQKIEELESQGILVRIVFSPYLPVYRHKIINFEELTAEIKQELKVPVYDYSDLLKNEEYFGDRVHCNKLGAIELGNTLLKENIFTY